MTTSLKFVIGFALLGVVLGHSYHTGKCPEVQGMPDFSIEKFLGQWYVVQKTSSSAKCLINNYTRDATGALRFDQVSRHALLGATSDDGRYHYSGSLEHREGAPSAADMLVRFKLNLLGAASYIVVQSDYTNVAAVVSCQELPVGHRISSSILSRTPTLSKEHLEKARAALAAAKVEVEELTDLVQTGDECTTAPSPVRSFVDSAGATLSKAASAVKDGAKKLYDKVRGEDSDESREIMGVKVPEPAKDSEWLP